jgi:rhodanese-related sulfurtransferase
MEHLPEFISNNIFLCGGFVVVLLMVIKTEMDHQTSRAFKLNPVNAIRMMNDGDTLLLDVRETADYGKSHIKDAKNVPSSSLKDKLKDILQYKDKAVLAYCASGATSAQACKTLKNAGFTNVHSIDGGLSGWLDAKLPVTEKTKH